MDHTMGLDGGWATLNLIANLVIVAGYVIVPFTVLRYLPLSSDVRASGVLFFVTCAMTHLGMAFDFHDTVFMVVNHVVQAGAVIWFVISFWRLLRAALRRAEEKRLDG